MLNKSLELDDKAKRLAKTAERIGMNKIAIAVLRSPHFSHYQKNLLLEIIEDEKVKAL